MAIPAEIEEVGALIVLDAARLRRGERGCKRQFLEWGERPTKAGSSPAAELQ